MRSNQKGNVVLILGGFLAIAAIAVAGFFLWQRSQVKPAPNEVSWEECIKIPEARVQESYPARCVTPDGRSATQPVVQNEDVEWKNSACGNGVCEKCESDRECCNYAPKKDKNGQTVYPPPTCMGKCARDCSNKKAGHVVCGEPDSQGTCPEGCVNYGVPLGCITTEDYENCEKSEYGCPICLSSETRIATSGGEIKVTSLQVGMKVWTLDGRGNRELQPIVKLSSKNVGKKHSIYRLALSDGRTVDVSPNHPTADGRTTGQLSSGDKYDNSTVLSNQTMLYTDSKTYDLLPNGDTGYYFANGILMGSTLK